MIIEISVTEEDIIKGNPRNTRSCPVFRAVTRTLKGRPIVVLGVGVFAWSGRVETKDRWEDFSGELPIFAANRITAMIRGEKVDPFTFPLNMPVKYNPNALCTN